MSVRLQSRPMRETIGMIGRDGVKVTTGLAVSVALAIALPRLAAALEGVAPITTAHGALRPHPPRRSQQGSAMLCDDQTYAAISAA